MISKVQKHVERNEQRGKEFLTDKKIESKACEVFLLSEKIPSLSLFCCPQGKRERRKEIPLERKRLFASSDEDSEEERGISLSSFL